VPHASVAGCVVVVWWVSQSSYKMCAVCGAQGVWSVYLLCAVSEEPGKMGDPTSVRAFLPELARAAPAPRSKRRARVGRAACRVPRTGVAGWPTGEPSPPFTVSRRS
jgi:hypothetical protein